jgi:hypothetical protein
MAQLFIACTRCGDPLPVDSEVLKNAIALGEDIAAAHDVCPGQEPTEPAGEAPALRRFRLQLIMWEVPPKGDPIYRSEDNPEGIPLDTPVTWKYVSLAGSAVVEELAGTGHTVDARNFAEAVNGPLTTWLNQTWPKMQESAAFADLPTTSDV